MLAPRDNLGAERRQACQPVCGRIGMGQAAADGPARAHGAIGDAARHASQKATGRIGNAAILDGGMRDRRTQRDGVGVLVHGGQLWDARDVDK